MTRPSTAIDSDLRKLATGTVVTFGGLFLGNAIIYLYGLMIARLMGATTTGLYFLAMVVMQVVSAVCRLGLPEGMLRFVSIHNGKGDVSRVKGTIISAISITSMTSVIAAVMLFLLAESLSIHVFKTPEVASYVKWFAVSLPFFTNFVLITNTIQALKRIDFVVIPRDFVQPVSMLIVSLILFYFMKSYTSFLMAHLLSVVISLGVALYLLGNLYPVFSRSIPALFEWKVLLAFSLPITWSDLSHYLFRWSDTFLLSFFRTSSEVGIYNAALRTTLLLNLIAVSLNSLYAPIIADHYHQNRHQEIQLILKTIIRWCLTLTLPLVFAMSALSGDILTLWGPEFVIGSKGLIILALSQLVFVPSNLLAFTFLMCGKQYLEVGNTAFVTILNIAANFILIPQYGMLGAAISMLASQIIAFLIRLIELRYFLGFHLYSVKYMKPFAALCPVFFLIVVFRESLVNMSSFVFMGSNIGLIFMIFSIIFVGYFSILCLFGFEKEDVLLWKEFQLKKKLIFSRS